MTPSAVSIFLLISLFLLSSLSNARSPPKPKTFVFPIKKDGRTNQYYTGIQVGSNSTSLNVVIDLGGRFLWFNSMDYLSSTSSYSPIPCGSQLCRMVDGAVCLICYVSPFVPGECGQACAEFAHNPFTGTRGTTGLGQDSLRVYSTRGDNYTINSFPFQFSDPILREGLATSVVGVVGLGRAQSSLPAQLAFTFKIRQKFALCLASSSDAGTMIIGQGSYKNSPFREISRRLVATPLIRNPVGTFGNEVIGNLKYEYFINVKSIRVGDTVLSLNTTLLSIDKSTGAGGTSIRTVRRYTAMHRSIYSAMVNEFVKAAEAKNVTRVASVVPFGACFDSKTILTSKTGPEVPTIDLVLQSKTVHWRIYGSNSMVAVSDGVSCLAFIEGATNIVGPTTSIVVGSYQMENHLLEFDEASSRLRFSSSLLLDDTSCSSFGAS